MARGACGRSIRPPFRTARSRPSRIGADGLAPRIELEERLALVATAGLALVATAGAGVYLTLAGSAETVLGDIVGFLHAHLD